MYTLSIVTQSKIFDYTIKESEKYNKTKDDIIEWIKDTDCFVGCIIEWGFTRYKTNMKLENVNVPGYMYSVTLSFFTQEELNLFKLTWM